MALCACKCLNIYLESDKWENNVDCTKLELTPLEQRDIFFNEKLILVGGSSLKALISQSALIGQRNVGRWEINSCLSCGQTTHAVLQGQSPIVLICKDILTSLDEINKLKKSTKFSPVFNLIVPDISNDVEMKENIDTNNLLSDKKKFIPAQQALGILNKQLSITLQAQLEAVEENVRQFRDQKYAEFEAYKERAQRDHKILTNIISKARSSIDNSGWQGDASNNGPLSPQLPPLQRRRLSSLKDAKKFHHQTHIKKHIPQEEDSLDAEDIFDIEGTDSNMSRNDMISDQDDYDSDNSGSNDEGIHISRGRMQQVNNDFARSLPISMPKFPIERVGHRDIDDYEETQDIAASIKALAQSVHGDVFGELPRPRFSTQI